MDIPGADGVATGFDPNIGLLPPPPPPNPPPPDRRPMYVQTIMTKISKNCFPERRTRANLDQTKSEKKLNSSL